MTENNTQHAPVRAAAPTTLTAEEIKAQLTESGIPEHLHPYFPPRPRRAHPRYGH